MGYRRTSWVGLLLVPCIGCNDPRGAATGAAGGSEDTGQASSSTTGEELEDLCLSTLDPATFTAPAWSPPRFEATPTCPALDGTLVVELSTVMVEGIVRVDGVPTGVEVVRLVGRDSEGSAGISVAEDGTFSARVLSGHYDVWVSSAPGALIDVERLVVEDLDLSQAVDALLLDVPPLVVVQGLMTLDGEPAPDPTAHLFIEELDGGSSLLARMDAGLYSAQLAPGEYRVVYSSCSPDWDAIPDVGENPCYDPDVVLSPPFASPQQVGAPVADDLVIDNDVQLDVDVPTVRLTGSVTVVGLPDDDPALVFRHSDSAGGGQIWPADALDERVVAGTYLLSVRGGAPIIDPLALYEDTEIDESVEAYRVSFAVAPDRPEVDVPYDAGPRVVVTGAQGRAIWDEHLPLAESFPLLPDQYSVRHLTKYCWPDLTADPPFITTTLHQALGVDGPMDVTLTTPQLARIEVEYAELGSRPDFIFEMLPVGEFTKIGLYSDEPSFVAHGVVPAGEYTLRGEPVDVVDGMRIRLVEESQMLDAEFVVDGTPYDPGERVWLDAPRAIRVGDWVRPGRYEIKLSHHEAVPHNAGAVVGCVTVEG